MKLGFDKRWFVMPSAPLISRNIYFALPTIALGFLVGLIGLSLPSLDPDGNLVLIAFGLWGMSFVLAYFEPAWLSPAWYRWLKREHGDIMPYLAVDAHEMGRQAWLQRVETQAGLADWVEEVRRKYQL